MSVLQLAFTIAALGLAVGCARACYRLLIGRRSWWFRAVVSVVGLGYGLDGGVGRTPSVVLGAAGLLAGATILRDTIVRSERAGAAISGRISRPDPGRRSTQTVDADSTNPHHRSSAGAGRYRCVHARTPRVT